VSVASGDVAAGSEVPAEGWTPAAPWSLRCSQPALALGLVEPVAERHRTLVVLNVSVMALALLLGGFAVQQARRRERLEVERQLFHAERLATVGRLAAGIAHEINNPLEGMANYLVLARRALEAADTEGAKRYLAGAREGLERAAGVVRQVLSLADPARAPHTRVDLNQILRETGRFVESRKEFSKVAFCFELANGPLAVHGSAAMLGQVAVNLILNACEAQPEGGEVRVSTRREGAHRGRVRRPRPRASRGRPRADFEPFFSTKSPRAWASRSATPSSGSTRASSSRFRAKAAARSSGWRCRPSRPGYEARGARTSVVEEGLRPQPGGAAGLPRLRRDGLGSVSEATAFLVRATVDLVLTDLRMPEADGRSWCDACRRPLPECPSWSSRATAPWPRRWSACGPGRRDYVLKPADPDVLKSPSIAPPTRSLKREVRYLRSAVAPDAEARWARSAWRASSPWSMRCGADGFHGPAGGVRDRKSLARRLHARAGGPGCSGG
jgi:CheY-like chemotaxis protein